MNVGENIKRIRQEQGMTQQFLADQIGISASMLCQIERGSKVPTVVLGYQIAMVLKCTVNDLCKPA